MKKVIVTGASGFIGRHVLDPLLKLGYEVHAITTNSQKINHKGCTWHVLNLMDHEKVDELFSNIRPTHFLHLAWELTPKKYITSLNNFLWIEASIKMLSAFQKNGGKRVVIAGTCMEEHIWNSRECCNEDIHLNTNINVYGTCKNILRQYMQLFTKETNISSAWGRIFYTFGPYEHPDRLFPYVINNLLVKKEVNCSHGILIKDYLYVKDLAVVLSQLLDSNLQGTVNIGSGNPIFLKDIILKISQHIGHPELLRFGAIKTQNSEPKIVVADVTRLKNELNWTPLYDFEQGLQETIDWWKQQLD